MSETAGRIAERDLVVSSFQFRVSSSSPTASRAINRRILEYAGTKLFICRMFQVFGSFLVLRPVCDFPKASLVFNRPRSL